MWNPGADGAQLVGDVKGLLQFTVLVAKIPYLEGKYMQAWCNINLGLANEEDFKFVVGVGTKAEEVSAAAKGMWNLWKAAAMSDWNTLEAAASGNLEEAWLQSETHRLLNAYMVEAVVAINNEYVESSAFKRGEIKGRVTLEVALIILPLAKAAQVSKATVLTRLTEIQWIRDNQQLLRILNEVLGLVRARPVMLPPPVWGDAGERIVAAAELEIRSGAPLADTYIKYMQELVPNAGEHNIAKRVGSLSETMVQRLPADPNATDMRAVASVRQVNNLIESKAVQEVAVADGESSFVVYDASVPSGNTQVHHTVPQDVIERLQQIGYPNLDLDGCPAMVLDQIDHVGIQPWTADALHTQMKQWNGGVLSWQRVLGNNNAQQLVDELIGFYQSKCPGWEKSIRGWANMNGLPHSL